jgi:GTP1/Obg family GTP-binding protein
LARVQLGRAAAKTANATVARQAYADFLALWEDADSDLRILQEARAEAKQLK